MNDSSDIRMLGAWVAEWTDWQNLRESLSSFEAEASPSDADSLSSEAAREALLKAVQPYGALPAPVGEVRLLSASLTPKVERPVYVAVLQETGEWRLVVPFSPFSVPGTPDELLLGDLGGVPKDAFSGGLAVLAVREAVWVTSEQLRKSWSAGRLPSKSVEDAEAVLLAYFNGAPLDYELKERVGARASHRRSDPRHAYISEEANLLAELGGLQPVWIEESTAVKETRAHSFAADDAEARAEIRVFQVPEKGVELKLLRDAGSSSAVLSVLDTDGEPSEALDGCKIYGIRGAEVAVISGAAARVAVEQLAGAFGLKTPEGKPLKVIRKV